MLYRYAIFETKGGWFGAIYTLVGLHTLTLPCSTEAQAKEQLGITRFPTITKVWQNGALQEGLDRYFSGEKVKFHSLIDWSGYTPFQCDVLQYTHTIGYGEAVAYGDVAKAIGRPKASRAVGQALHINRTPIVVPCHRVLASGSKIGGFGGGLDCKRTLLNMEGIRFCG
jgi:methylated-DNA-[protein]-cysteine S-methyltransferase